MPTSLKNVHCIHKTCFATFYDFGVYPITENFPFFIHLFEAILKTAANPEETLHSTVQKNMRVFLHLDLV